MLFLSQPDNPPTPQKSLRICENLMGAFLKVGGFEPTQTHPWPRHWMENN